MYLHRYMSERQCDNRTTRYTVGERVLVFVPGQHEGADNGFGMETPARLLRMKILAHDACGNSRTKYAH